MMFKRILKYICKTTKGNIMITLSVLEKICSKTKSSTLEQYIAPLSLVCEKYDITTKKRMAAFLAQLAHESGGFNFTKENLNYSSAGLLAVFKKYFPTEDVATRYARQPEKIANKVYANRMGNGDESSGDGWKYRGRGLIQLTGKNNYTSFAEDFDMTLETAVEYLETTEGSSMCAGWFWDKNNLNEYIDRDDFVGLTKRINGGTNGLEDRQKYYDIALDALGKK